MACADWFRVIQYQVVFRPFRSPGSCGSVRHDTQACVARRTVMEYPQNVAALIEDQVGTRDQYC